MGRFRTAMIVVGLASGCAVSAQASTLLFTDQTEFFRLAEPDAFESFDDPTLIPEMTIVSLRDRWSRVGMIHDAVSQGTGGTVLQFSRALSAFGALWDLRAGGVDRGLRLSLLYVDGSVEPVAWMTPQVAHGFVGVSSSRAFTALRIEHAGLFRGGNETYALDNVAIRYAPVIGTAVVVPEPSVWALSIAGFAIAGAALRRRRVSAAVARPCGRPG